MLAKVAGRKILIGAKSPASLANAKGQERSPGLGQYREASAAPVERPSASRRPFWPPQRPVWACPRQSPAGRGQGHRQRRPEERGRRPRRRRHAGPSTVRLSLAEADVYLASFSGVLW